MKIFAGLLLGDRNCELVLVDNDGQEVYRGRLVKHLEDVVAQLKPFKQYIVAISTSTTMNDANLTLGLIEQGYNVHLANMAWNYRLNAKWEKDYPVDAINLANSLKVSYMKRSGMMIERLINPLTKRSSTFAPEQSRKLSDCQPVQH